MTKIDSTASPPSRPSTTKGAGRGSLAFRRSGGKTVLAESFATSPLRLLAPRDHGSGACVFLANFGGGLVDGDRIDIRVDAEENSTAFVTFSRDEGLSLPKWVSAAPRRASRRRRCGRDRSRSGHLLRRSALRSRDRHFAGARGLARFVRRIHVRPRGSRREVAVRPFRIANDDRARWAERDRRRDPAGPHRGSDRAAYSVDSTRFFGSSPSGRVSRACAKRCSRLFSFLRRATAPSWRRFPRCRRRGRTRGGRSFRKRVSGFAPEFRRALAGARRQSICTKVVTLRPPMRHAPAAMHLSPRDIDKLLLHGAGALAQKRLARGLRLNYPEAVAFEIATQLLELLVLCGRRLRGARLRRGRGRHPAAHDGDGHRGGEGRRGDRWSARRSRAARRVPVRDGDACPDASRGPHAPARCSSGRAFVGTPPSVVSVLPPRGPRASRAPRRACRTPRRTPRGGPRPSSPRWASGPPSKASARSTTPHSACGTLDATSARRRAGLVAARTASSPAPTPWCT